MMADRRFHQPDTERDVRYCHLGRKRQRETKDFQITFGSLQLLLGYIIIPAITTRYVQEGAAAWVEKHHYSINNKGD